MNIPNLLTMLRIISIPFFMAIFYSSSPYAHYFSAGLFILAGLTDWLDGYLARKLGQYSAFGAFLDPVADKLIVAAALVMLAVDYAEVYITIPAILIILREITISALREWMAALGKGQVLAVSYIGKVKTTSQILAITCLLAKPIFFAGVIVKVGVILLYLALVLTLYSMWAYFKAAGKIWQI